MATLYVNSNGPRGDVGIILDKETKIVYHINNSRYTRVYNLILKSDNEYHENELLEGKGFSSDTIYTITNNGLEVTNITFDSGGGRDHVSSTVYNQKNECTITCYCVTPTLDKMMEELYRLYPQFKFGIIESDSD